MRRSRSRGLAWGLGGAGALLCCVSAAVVLWVGAPMSFLLIYVVGVLMGLLGPLVAAREPGNSIGWLMCATSLVASLVQLPAGYAYFALIVQHGAWPLGPFALWLGTWSWVPVVVFLPLISVRFPDGKLPRRGRAVDWIAIAGAATLALAIVLAPRAVELDLMAFPSPRIDQMQAFFSSPVSGLLRGGHFLVQSVGLAGIVAGYRHRRRRSRDVSGGRKATSACS
ncbi:MAG TPA: hypothetical protein VJR46_00040 [Candidatus Dormibacteraeota bacterium]|nr:hypothetical protein [Candidatus Dormibacteraeota bacterium]